jgi:surfeit locus 1 family protein
MTRRFRPKLRPTIFAAAGIAALVGLGCWQMKRLEWKEVLLAEITRSMSAAPATLPAGIADAGDWNYRRVVLEGRFDYGSEALLQSRSRQGRPGRHVLTLLRREDGPPVLVDRGWVPEDADIGQIDRPEGAVRVEGIARAARKPGRFVPDNRPEEGLWYWADPAGFAPDAPPLVVEAAGTGPGLPIGGASSVDIPNDHFQYALTWFSLAGALAAIYAVSQTRKTS